MTIDFSDHKQITAAAIQQLNEELSTKSPREILKFALKHFDNIAISFSGAEDVTLIELAHKMTDKLNVFSLDTGRLHPQTYRFIEKVRKHYQLEIELMTPNQEKLVISFIKKSTLNRSFPEIESINLKCLLLY